MAFEIVTKNNVRDRFISHPRPDIWKDVSDKDWNSWIWQQQKRIKSMDVLEKVINVTDDERNAFAQSHEMFNMGITPYYASLMDKDDPNCPIRQQAVPKTGELTILPTEMEDPLAEERDMPVPGITHRYPDRVLFYTTHNCPVYCRHCTRKRKVSDPSSSAANKQLEESLDTSQPIKKFAMSLSQAATRFRIQTTAWNIFCPACVGWITSRFSVSARAIS